MPGHAWLQPETWRERPELRDAGAGEHQRRQRGRRGVFPHPRAQVRRHDASRLCAFVIVRRRTRVRAKTPSSWGHSVIPSVVAGGQPCGHPCTHTQRAQDRPRRNLIPYPATTMARATIPSASGAKGAELRARRARPTPNMPTAPAKQARPCASATRTSPLARPRKNQTVSSTPHTGVRYTSASPVHPRTSLTFGSVSITSSSFCGLRRPHRTPHSNALPIVSLVTRAPAAQNTTPTLANSAAS